MYETTSATSIIGRQKTRTWLRHLSLSPVKAADEGSKDAEKKAPKNKTFKGEELEASVSELNTALKSLNVRREFTIEKGHQRSGCQDHRQR